MYDSRFSSKLAEAIDASGRLCCTMTEASDMACAVERLTKAARAIVDSYSLDTHCGCGVCCECKLVLEVEAAENWGL
jgi:hypothetical protein